MYLVNYTSSLLYNVLQRGSSPIDWCELNYVSSPFIAEMINTISNILFLILPPFLMPLSRQYANHIDPGIYLIWALFALVGICSAYFHATLSLLGQLLDELSIIWLFTFSTGMWLPKQYFPPYLHDDRRRFKKLMLYISLVVTCLALIFPSINHIAMMSLVIPTFTLLAKELNKSCTTSRAKRLGILFYLLSLGALTSWIIDRLFCTTWSTYAAPCLHGVWHLLVALAAYTCCILSAYLSATIEYAHLRPVLKYWPVDSLEMIGIAYVALDPAAG